MLRLIHQLCLIALAIAAVSIAAAQTPTISSISPNPGGIGQSALMTAVDHVAAESRTITLNQSSTR